MKSERLTCLTTLTLLALTISVPTAAQDKAKQHHPHQYHHYQLVDVGTFGGPQSWMFSPGAARTGLLNNQGTLAGSADTLAVDPYCFWSPDCFVAHGFRWQEGAKTDLGVLSGGSGSQVNWISANGLMAGISDNGQQDPLNPSFPQVHAVVWAHGAMTDLGNLPEGGYDTWATAVNSRGEIAGQAYNTIPDINSLFGYGYQSRAFYWKNGTMQDLGTLGIGTQAMAGLINERGQVVGWSYTSSIANPTCAGISAFTLTTDSFIWDPKDGMKDIGGLGGACTLANDLNNKGQIIGGSSLSGDTNVHPFVWNAATGVTDLLDPSDSSYGFAEGENARGDATGGTCDSVTCYAVLWRKRGGHWQKMNLSTVSQAAFSISINSSQQVVGNWSGGAFLSEDGGPIVDLSTLVSPGSGLQFSEALQINDRGEIAVNALDASGNNHAVLLIPCDENHPEREGCDYSLVDASATAEGEAPRQVPSQPLPSRMQRLFHSRPGDRYHISSRVPEGGVAALAAPASPDYTRPHVFYVSLSVLTPSAVNPGGSSTSAVTVGITGEVASGTAALACSVQPSPPLAPICSISPASLSFPGTPATLTVSTVGPSGALLSHRDQGLLYALWLPLIGLVATGAGLGSNPNRHKGKLKKAALVWALFAGLTFPLACGGGSSQRTPPGTYTINVTATAFIPVNTSSTSTTIAVQ
jgi:probable HAF family extracellular repeat protein